MNRILLCVLCLLCLTASVTAAEPRKNIILILADDLGWADTTLYGKTSLYETPNIERLAARGMTFSNAYAASPICSPTRASIISGQNPARHGMTAPAGHLPDVRFKPIANTSGPPHQKSANVRSATRLDPSIPTLAQLLKNAGYATAHFGKWHLGMEPHTPLELGFDVDIPHWHGPGPKSGYLAPWNYPTLKEHAPGEHIEDRMADEAVAWLKNRDRTKPVFMNYWQFSVHAPFGAKPELIDRYRHKIKRGAAQQSPTYAAMIHSLDDAVGSLLATLDDEGIADETVIIFYSDNGGNVHCGLEETSASGERYTTAITSNHPLRGGKGGIHEGGIRVPAVVVWPGVTKSGSRSEVRIQSTDLYPTILHMLNVDHPQDHQIDGIDFGSALRGEKMVREPMFTLVPGHGNTPQWLPPSIAVHYGDWKLIRTFYYGEAGNHDYRLYNLREDIGEDNNLVADHPDKVKTLDKLIEDYIAEAKVVVPLPNPKFDPKTFDPTQIGVQAGGLKMPPSANKPQQNTGAAKPLKTVNNKSMLGWIAKGGDISVQSGSLRISAIGRSPLLTNAKVRTRGPAVVKLRLRTSMDCTSRLQWRTEDQELFPKTGQSKSFDVTGGDWQTLSVPLATQDRVVHVRLFTPAHKQSLEIDWIEIGPSDGKTPQAQRWDFDGPVIPSETKNKEVATPSRPKQLVQAPLEFSETFDEFDPDRFQTQIPNKNTQVRNGVLWTRGESGGKYPPMVYLNVAGKDLEVSFRYRHLENGGMVWFFVDGDDGFGSIDHMLRVKLNRTGVQLQIDAHSLDPNHPDRQNGDRPADKVSGAYRLNKKLPQEDVDLSANVWRQLKLVFQGDTVTISVDGETWSKTVIEDCFNAAKRKLLWMQKGGDKGIEIDDIKVTQASGGLPQPDVKSR